MYVTQSASRTYGGVVRQRTRLAADELYSAARVRQPRYNTAADL
jgi:hypothetical protein